MTVYPKAEVAEATQRLTLLLVNATEIQVIFRHVSASGMTRWLDLAVVNAQGDIERLGWSAALVLGWNYSTKHNGIRVDGAGMDMGFHLVSSLCVVLGWKYDKIKHHWL